MEVIQPTPNEKRPTLEEVRENLLESWGDTLYYQTLEDRVKENHSDIFKFVEKYPTWTIGYSVLSELYKLEETIMNTRYLVEGLENAVEFNEARSAKDLEVKK